MKIIKYFYNSPINKGTKEKPEIVNCLMETTVPYSETNEEIAKKEAYNGEYTIEDDGAPEPGPSQMDVIEAQVTYTAMMTDTLLEV